MDARTGALIFVLWSSGIIQPLLIQEIGYEGAGSKYTLLYMVPNYVGMALLLLWPPPSPRAAAGDETDALAAAADGPRPPKPTPALFAAVLSWPRTYRVLFIAALDVFSFSGAFLGMMLAGALECSFDERRRAGTNRLKHKQSSVTTTVALLGWWLLDKRLNTGQWLGCLTVTVGLAVSAVGDSSSGGSVAAGALIVFVATVLHSFMYVANEAVMTRGGDQLPPVRLAGLVGLFGVCVMALWQLAYTLPRWHSQVQAPLARHGTSAGRVAVLYVATMLVDLVHAGVFYVLLGEIGSVTTGVLKGATAISVFAFSHFLFCDAHDSQCFTAMKGVSLALVVGGVFLYSWAVGRDDAKKAADDDPRLSERLLTPASAAAGDDVSDD